MKNSILLTLVFFLSCSSSQFETNRANDVNNFIKLDLVEMTSINDEVQFELFIKIPTNKLVFYKNAEGFFSSLSINIIFSKDEKVILTDAWSEEISKIYFEDTKSTENIIINRNMNLPIGEYNINLIVNDYENNISWLREMEFTLNDSSNMSDILLFEKNEGIYESIFGNRIEYIDTAWVMLTFYNVNDEYSDLDLKYDFFYIDDIKEENLNTSDIIYYEDDILYSENITDQITKDGTYYYPIKIVDEFFNGLKIEAFYKDSVRDEVVVLDREKEISYILNKVIGPMQYILENADFKKFREYTKLSEVQKIEFIQNYWDISYDSNETILVSDLFKEFYSRIEYVNIHFKDLSKEGWNSDRGRVYIIYGKPFSIKNEFTSDGEYEIWLYKNNQQFVFVNRFGTYVLTSHN